MGKPKVVIDAKQITYDTVHHTAITKLSNLNMKTLEVEYAKYSYDPIYVKKTIQILESLTHDKISMLIPKRQSMPMILTPLNCDENSPVYFIAPVEMSADKEGESSP